MSLRCKCENAALEFWKITDLCFQKPAQWVPSPFAKKPALKVDEASRWGGPKAFTPSQTNMQR